MSFHETPQALFVSLCRSIRYYLRSLPSSKNLNRYVINNHRIIHTLLLSFACMFHPMKTFLTFLLLLRTFTLRKCSWISIELNKCQNFRLTFFSLPENWTCNGIFRTWHKFSFLLVRKAWQIFHLKTVLVRFGSELVYVLLETSDSGNLPKYSSMYIFSITKEFTDPSHELIYNDLSRVNRHLFHWYFNLEKIVRQHVIHRVLCIKCCMLYEF